MPTPRQSPYSFFDPSKEMVIATNGVLPAYDGGNLQFVKPAATRIEFSSLDITNVLSWDSEHSKATFTHTMNCYPIVTVLDDAGQQVYPNVVIVSGTSFILDFETTMNIQSNSPWTCIITYGCGYGQDTSITDELASNIVLAQQCISQISNVKNDAIMAASKIEAMTDRVEEIKSSIEVSYKSVLMGACKDLSVIFGTPICLSWTDPDDFELNGTKFATWWKTELWRYPSNSQYPEYPGYPGAELIVTTEVGGEHVRNAFQSTPFYDNTAVAGLTYTYALFSYNANGSYNMLNENRFPIANTWNGDTLHLFSQNGTILNYITPGQLFTMSHSDFTGPDGSHDIPVRFMGYDCVQAWDTDLYPHCAVFQTADCLYGSITAYGASQFDATEKQYSLTADTSAVAGRKYYVQIGNTYTALTEGVDYDEGDTTATLNGVTYDIRYDFYEKNPNPNYNSGTNRWDISDVREYLNADAASAWSVKKNIFENASGYAGRKGFLYGLDASVKRNLIPVRRTLARSNTFGGGQYQTKDKVFLPTSYEVFNTKNNIAEGLKQWDWYGNWYGDEAERYSNNFNNKRIKTLNGNSGNIWWCSSAGTGGGSYAYLVTATGTSYTTIAYNAYGLSPAYAL